MKNDFLVSIITPVYNMEQYLSKCIDSILSQTYKNFELILVDDGSVDNSLQVCEEYKSRDSRIKIFCKKNGGQGEARNLGIDKCSGYFITFIDSDDIVDKDYLKVLLQNIVKYDCDISSIKSNNDERVIGSGLVSIFEQPEIMKQHLVFGYGIDQSPCNKMFRKSLFETVRFPIKRAYEDTATIYKLLHLCKKVVIEDITLYHYIPRINSTMTQKFSIIKYESIYSYYELYEFYRLNCPQYAYLAKERLLGAIKYCIGESNKDSQYKIELKKVRKILKLILTDDIYISKKNIVIANLILSFRILYKIVYYLFGRRK